MVNALRFTSNFLMDCRGASAAEYALMLAVVGAVLAMSAFVLGDTIAASMDNSAEVFHQAGCNNNGQGTGTGGGNGGGGGNGSGNGDGNSC
jgi:pilus assembly protein Flp/PilA